MEIKFRAESNELSKKIEIQSTRLQKKLVNVQQKFADQTHHPKQWRSIRQDKQSLSDMAPELSYSNGEISEGIQRLPSLQAELERPPKIKKDSSVNNIIEQTADASRPVSKFMHNQKVDIQKAEDILKIQELQAELDSQHQLCKELNQRCVALEAETQQLSKMKKKIKELFQCEKINQEVFNDLMDCCE